MVCSSLVMVIKIKKIHFHLFIGLVATGIFCIADCLSDAAIDVSGTQQCYNIGGQEVCYFIGSEQLSEWHLAYEICERKDSTLPIIRNSDEQDVFEKYLKYLQLKRSSIEFVWTAGKRKNFNDWIWINGQPVSDKVRRSLHSGGVDATHASFMTNNSFKALDPDSAVPFLCQFYGDRCLLSGRIKLTNSCVIFSNFMDSWFNARSNCLARGGDLAVLSDQDLQILKNYSLTLRNQQLPITSSWIGLRNMGRFWHLDSEGKQTEEIKYKKFKRNVFANFGDECINIEALSGNWIKTDCSQKRSIICQRKGSTKTATTGNTNSLDQSGFIGPLTFAIVIAGVVLVCIGFSAIVGIIAARKASSSTIRKMNVRKTANVVFSSRYPILQQQSVEEDLHVNELRY